MGGAILRGEGRPIVKYWDTLPKAVQKDAIWDLDLGGAKETYEYTLAPLSKCN